MCEYTCRTRVIGNVNGDEVTDGRGNVSFTTLNLPNVAISSKSLLDFFSLLDERMDLVKDQLLHRFMEQCKLKVKDFRFLMGEHLYYNSENLNPDDSIREAIKHGTLSIGFCGLAETLVALLGEHHGQSDEALDLGENIVKYMRQRCDKYSKDYSLNFTLLASPAETTAGKMCVADTKRFGIIPGVTDKEWYTNSFHVPVEFEISMARKVEIEGRFHKYCNAGHISYVELKEVPKNNIPALKTIVEHMVNCDMGYFSINFPTDYCIDCGLQGVVIEKECPVCGSNNISRIRRITGYLSRKENFNDYKRAELDHRVKHM